MADFVSFNTSIACIILFGFESQFQKAFTNAKFKELQIEIASMMYCNAFLEGMENLNSTFCVIESKRVYDRFKDTRFEVFFNEKDFEIQCACCLFEFKGILCRHILRVLQLTGKTESVPSFYILSRWRKDIKRRHTLIKCGSDHLSGNVELQCVGKACDTFYEVASAGIHTEDDLLNVMNWIKDLKIELTCKESYPVIIEENSSVQKQMTKILNPTPTRSKGRPPSKRKASKVDQIVQKKLVGKKPQNSNKKSNSYQSQEEGLCLSRVQETENAEFSTSQIIDGIGTQESIQANLAPFNPNQKYLVEANQVPYYSQSINHNITCSELLEAQHHMNGKPS